MERIKEELKKAIVKSLKLEIDPGEFENDRALIDGDFEIDSIDILQLVVDIERNFGIKLVSGKFDRNMWKDINSLAAAIESIKKETV